jgi:hypothetical protein
MSAGGGSEPGRSGRRHIVARGAGPRQGAPADVLLFYKNVTP